MRFLLTLCLLVVVQTSSVVARGCCSHNHKVCSGWAGTTEQTCIQGAIWLENGNQQNCLPRWSGCKNDPDGCCGGSCRSPTGGTYMQCLADSDPPAITTQQTTPPTFDPSEAVCARFSGDPHMTTFDGLKYDCQGKGEFVIVKSQGEDPLEIHSRFVTETRWKGAPSVARSVAIKVDEDVPTLQVSVPDDWDASTGCPYSYNLDGDDVNANAIPDYFKNEYGEKAKIYTLGNKIILTFPDYSARIEILVWGSDFWGCHLRLNVCLTPEKHGGAENIVGLLGSPNNDKTDDWMKPDGETEIIPIGNYLGMWEQSTDWCINNWCVGDSADSMFDEDTFDEYNQCDSNTFDPDVVINEDIGQCEEAENPDECNFDIGIVIINEGDIDSEVDLFLQEENEATELHDCSEEEAEEWPTPAPTAAPTIMASGVPTKSPTSNPTLSPTKAPTPLPTSLPTKNPTTAPTTSPTLKPSPEPTLSPTKAPTPLPTPMATESNTEATAAGDPHFRTWKQEHFEYHGQCDLMLAKDNGFADGLGLDVQIRTKLVRFWSYIKSAAIRIGDDILEVQGSVDPSNDGIQYWFNLEYQGEVKTVGGFPVTLKEPALYKGGFEIDLSSKYPGLKILINYYKEFVKVDFQNGTEEAFENVVGLLGNFKTGKTLGRDGSTEFRDFSQFGNEWQVLPFEDMLFHDVEQPQFPKKCVEPEDPRGDRRRRLGESTISEAEAEKACASVANPLDRKDCIYDILATQDIGMVGAY